MLQRANRPMPSPRTGAGERHGRAHRLRRQPVLGCFQQRYPRHQIDPQDVPRHAPGGMWKRFPLSHRGLQRGDTTGEIPVGQLDVGHSGKGNVPQLAATPAEYLLGTALPRFFVGRMCGLGTRRFRRRVARQSSSGCRDVLGHRRDLGHNRLIERPIDPPLEPHARGGD